MANPVKTDIMVAIGEALSAIPELKTIKRFKGKPIDVDVISLPALFYHDESEVRVRENRIQQGVVTLLMTVFTRIPPESTSPNATFSDEADLIQAKVHNILFGTTNLRGLGVLKIQEEEVVKEYPNDTLGALNLRFTLTYGHRFGDAFNVVPM